MAANTPNDPKKNTDKNKKRSWLSTDDWLGDKPEETPTSKKKPVGGTELFDLGPSSGVQLGADANPSTPPSSGIIAKSDLSESSIEIIDDDEAIDLATPPGGATTGPPSLSKILKATGTKSDIIRGVPKDEAMPDSAGYTSTGPASGWLAKPSKGTTPELAAPSGDADIFTGAQAEASGGTGSNILPGLSGVSRSSVFDEPSRAGESDLFGGLTGNSGERGSSVFDDSARKTHKVPVKNDSDIFRGTHRPPAEDSPSDAVPLGEKPSGAFDSLPMASGPPSSAKLTDRLMAEIESSGRHAQPDFNVLDKTAGGSNLFDDVTAMDIDIGPESGISATSGVDWLDPNRVSAQDSNSGPGSSIFHKPPTEQPSDPYRVDLNKIPMMGSTDDPAEKVQPSDVDLAGPPSSVLKKELEKTMKELAGEKGAVSFELPAGDDSGTADSTIGAQMSMRMPLTEDELELAATPQAKTPLKLPTKKEKKKESDSVFDDVPEFPSESGILVNAAPMSGSILQGMTSDRLKHQAEAAAAATEKASPARRDRASRSSMHDFDVKPRGRNGALIGALALLAGAGLGAAGMYFGRPSDASRPIPPKDNTAVQIATQANAEEAGRLLAAGDPVGALALYVKIADETPETLAGKGQARWMVRQRSAAEKGEKLAPTDSELIIARTDLKSALDRAAAADTPENMKASLRAALNLGLILEVTGKPGDAVTHYGDMAKKLPAYQSVFESAKLRVTTMRKNPAAPGNLPDDKYSLSAEDAGTLNDINSILFAFVPVAEIDDEPGFHYWKAVNAAVGSDGKAMQSAIDAINAARKAHEARRAKLAGLGLNPLSDPTEQMFLKTCDVLKDYWAVKRTLYNNANFASIKGTTMERLNAVLSAGAELAKAVKRATDAEALVATTKKSLDAANAAATTLKTERDAKAKEAEQAMATVEKARQETAAAMDKLKATEAAIDPLIVKLKEAKLIDDKATREQALMAMPKVSIASAGGNAEMAKELTQLKTKYEADKADAAKKIADLETAVKNADAKVKTEVAKANAAAREQVQAASDRLAEAQLAMKRERDANEKKLRDQAESFREQIVAARAGGATLAMTDIERVAIDQAAKSYGQGLDAFNAKRWADAEKHFAAAAERNPNDARYWYYLGFAKQRQGREPTADFQRGVKLEEKSLPARDVVSADLLIVQGPSRAALDAIRP